MNNYEDDDLEFEKPTLEKVLLDNTKEIQKISTKIKNNIFNMPSQLIDWLRGEKRAGLFEGYFVNARKYIGYDDIVSRAETIFEKAKAIWHEKGYRFDPSLLTGREHKQCGSSGYGLFEKTMPDVPVPIANLTLKISKDMEIMTIEEVRKARELVGKPTIDANGKVTGEIVEISGSYHFLSVKRKAEIIELEQEIESGLKDLVQEGYSRHKTDLAEYQSLVDDVGYGRRTASEAYKKLQNLKLDNRTIQELNHILGETKNLSYVEGYRDDILTPMELMILGRDVDERYIGKPYTPLGIQKGQISINEANKIRNEEKFFIAETNLFTDYEYPWAFSLETLNKEGGTECGPVLMNREDGQPLSQEGIDYLKQYFKKVSFSRPQDVYHKLK